MIIYLYLLFVVWLAYRDANRLTKIRHWLNGLFHLTAAGVMFLIRGWVDCVCLLLLTRVFFDSFFALFRNMPIFYKSPVPKSVVDKIEYGIFRKPVIARIVYLIIVICLQISK